MIPDILSHEFWSNILRDRAGVTCDHPGGSLHDFLSYMIVIIILKDIK